MEWILIIGGIILFFVFIISKGNKQDENKTVNISYRENKKSSHFILDLFKIDILSIPDSTFVKTNTIDNIGRRNQVANVPARATRAHTRLQRQRRSIIPMPLMILLLLSIVVPAKKMDDRKMRKKSIMFIKR